MGDAMAVEPTGQATLEDVARVAGVSRATASRVVRGDAGVSGAKVDAVRAAVEALRYVPNRAARSLVTHRSDTIALIVPEPDVRVFSDPFFARIVQSITKSLEDTHIQLVMAFADRTGAHQRLRSFLANGHVDGAIVVSHHQIPGQIETFLRAMVPIVFIGRPANSTSAVNWVDVENREGGRKAARRIFERGARKIAIITGALDMVAAQDRLEGFISELALLGVTPRVVEGDFTSESGAHAGAQLVPLIEAGEVEAVFASSDMMAVAAMGVWRGRGIGVPDDVQVVSFDDSEAARQAEPPLTSLTNPVDTLGAGATRMLRDLMDHEDTERPLIIPTQLVERLSG